MPTRDRGRDCYLGIDLGTSGVRCVAIDDAGDVRAETRIGLPGSRRPSDGHSEQDPADWWQATREALDAIVRRAPGRVRALCVDGTSSTMLLCAEKGTPLGPALMYDDRRAIAQAKQIAALAPADCAAQGPGSTLAKLLFLLETGAGGRTALLAHQADWIMGCLSGCFAVTDENNALKLGYDPVMRCWPGWLTRLLPETLPLPTVVPVGTPLQVIAPGVARQLGLPEDARLVAGTTDSNAATLAAGAEEPGDAVTSLGSTLVLKIVSEVPVVSAAHGVYSHRIADRWLVGGASNSGGAVLRQYFDDKALAELSKAIDPRVPSRLDYYPLPDVGERFPRNEPRMHARLSPRPDDDVAFLHGLLEGMARIEAEGYALLARLGAPPPRRVLTSGGGARNTTWTRIRQRLLGIPVSPAPHTEAAYGVAQIARRAFGRSRD